MRGLRQCNLSVMKIDHNNMSEIGKGMLGRNEEEEEEDEDEEEDEEEDEDE